MREYCDSEAEFASAPINPTDISQTSIFKREAPDENVVLFMHAVGSEKMKMCIRWANASEAHNDEMARNSKGKAAHLRAARGKRACHWY